MPSLSLFSTYVPSFISVCQLISFPARQLNWHDGRDVWWHDLMRTADKSCDPVWMDAEDPLFMLYTRYVLALVFPLFASGLNQLLLGPYTFVNGSRLSARYAYCIDAWPSQDG